MPREPITANTVATPAPYSDDRYEISQVLSSRLDSPEVESQRRECTAGRAIDSESRTPVLFRHSGWTRTRKLVAEALARTEQSTARRDEFESCGLFAFVLRSLDDPDKYRIAGSCCRDRFCIPCATERSCIIASNVIEIIGDREVRFLTLTIKTHAEPLVDQLDKLYRSFQALRRRRIWTQNVHGGVAFLELKWSDSGERWHPHLHCLIEGTWIDKKRLQTTWREITGDSFVVDIRRPKTASSVTRYVTKYASKPMNTTFCNRPNLLDEAILALAGRKLCVTFGRWRGKLLTATPAEGSWERIGSLEHFISFAADGNVEAIAILAALTDRDLTDLLARAPPIMRTEVLTPQADRQQDFFGTWRADGTFTYRYES